MYVLKFSSALDARSVVSSFSKIFDDIKKIAHPMKSPEPVSPSRPPPLISRHEPMPFVEYLTALTASEEFGRMVHDVRLEIEKDHRVKEWVDKMWG